MTATLRLPTCFPLLLLSLLLGTRAGRAQTPDWQSAVAFDQAAGSDLYPAQLVADGSGNLLVAGSFTGTVHFGATTLTSLGGQDVFVAKWNPASGSFAWAQQAGGTADETMGAIIISGPNLYVSGTFGSPTVRFGTTTLTNRSYRNFFVAKLTDAGASASFTWALRGGVGLPTATGLAVSGSSVYVAGSFAGTGDFGALTLSSTSSYKDAFVSKITDAGPTASFTWTQRLGGASDDYATALVLSGTSLYVTGNLASPVATVGATALPATSGSGQFFMSKFTDAGLTVAHNWTQRGGSTLEACPGTALAVVGSSLYVAGTFGGAATFGAVTLQRQGSSGTDVFVAKLTDLGSSAGFAWVQPAGGTTDYDFAYGLVVRGNGVYVAGDFYGTAATFGPLTLTNTDDSGTTRDVFVTKLTDAGTSASFSWVQQAGYRGNDYAGPLVALGAQLYLAGFTHSSDMDFGSLHLRNPVMVGSHYGGYLASLTDATSLATTAPAGGSSEIFPNPAAVGTRVHLPGRASTGPARLLLTNAVGQVVRAQTLPAGATGPGAELDLTGLAPGVYALRIEAAGERVVHRLLIQ